MILLIANQGAKKKEDDSNILEKSIEGATLHDKKKKNKNKKKNKGEKRNNKNK